MEQITQSPLPENPKRSNRTLRYILAFFTVAILCFAAYRFGKFTGRKEYLKDHAAEKPVDSVFVSGWASDEEYDYWKNTTFTIPGYDQIPVPFRKAIVKIFIDNKYYTTNEYFFTKIKDRAHRVIAYGDFTGGGDREMAFLVEKRDFTSSALFIISERGDLIYWKQFEDELPTIKQFSKGALIYLDQMQLVRAPSDGIIRQTKNSKYVLIYNHQTKTFDSYYQYTADEIREAKEEAEQMEAEGTADTVGE